MSEARVIEKKITAAVRTHQVRATIVTTDVKVAQVARQGERGLPGKDGEKGDIGPAGPAGGEAIVFVQNTPLQVWTITHNLSRFPSITVVNSALDEVEGDVTYLDSNSIQVSFSGAFSGTAYLN